MQFGPKNYAHYAKIIVVEMCAIENILLKLCANLEQPSLKLQMPMYNQHHLVCNELNLQLFLEKCLMHVVGQD